ncbi:MAG TPA: potassium transporter Kup [Aestuariivirgaceae bacterium]|nr:potassium transporter Kup [Aestuariivirgaceae bacterium]
MTEGQFGELGGQTLTSKRKVKFGLAFGSIGVVFGDIGTSPLYALREALAHSVEGDVIARADVLGVVSLLIWALLIIVTLKYVFLLLEADNRGEGGILALVTRLENALKKRGGVALFLGVVGAAFFFGDAMITPAISVLSAIEGLRVINPAFADYVVPLTLIVLATLFAVQFRGTAGIANYFAPVTAIWFLALAVMGLSHIIHDPGILLAFNPAYGLVILGKHPGVAFLILGGVFLAVTGSEALYADMGHFGREPIRLAWLSLVLPSLLLNYLGQGALIYANPAAGANPFFLMVPEIALIPLVVLATMVTVIASQAVITGAFSMAQQAIHLGLLPRMNISHTSETEHGQVYVSQINWMLFVGIILLVLTFRSSSALASAYGIAVNTAMLIDSILAFMFFRMAMRWPLPLVIAVIGFVFVVESAFLIANGYKVLSGGYVPIFIGISVVMIMITWMRGREALAQKLRRDSVELKGLLESLERKPPVRVPGEAIFLVTDPQFAPSALLHNLKHNRVLHETLVFIHVNTADEPRVTNADRLEVTRLPLDAWLVKATFGFMETPNVPAALRLARSHDLDIDPRTASYFLGRRAIRTSARSALPFWQQRLFIMLANQSSRATGFYRIPPDRVVELGMQLSV